METGKPAMSFVYASGKKLTPAPYDVKLPCKGTCTAAYEACIILYDRAASKAASTVA